MVTEQQSCCIGLQLMTPDYILGKHAIQSYNIWQAADKRVVRVSMMRHYNKQLYHMVKRFSYVHWISGQLLYLKRLLNSSSRKCRKHNRDALVGCHSFPFSLSAARFSLTNLVQLLCLVLSLVTDGHVYRCVPLASQFAATHRYSLVRFLGRASREENV